MKKYILSIMLFVITLTTANFAVVRSSSTQYQQEQKQQFVTKEEVYKWRDEMQNWFDKESEIDLLLKVASRSEVHGYVNKGWGGN